MSSHSTSHTAAPSEPRLKRSNSAPNLSRDGFEQSGTTAHRQAQTLGQPDPKATQRLQEFLSGKGPVDIKTQGPKIKNDLAAMDPQLAETFKKADAVTKDLYGRPMQILPKPANVAHSISYAHGNVYLDPRAPRGQLVGGMIFEGNNAVRDHIYRGIEKDWTSGKIMTAKAEEYGITDPQAKQRFASLQTPHERRAFAQEYHEWDHMMQQSVPQQNRIASHLGNDPWVNYLHSANSDKLQPGGPWSTFSGYLQDNPTHYNAVHTAVAQSPGAEEATAAAALKLASGK